MNNQFKLYYSSLYLIIIISSVLGGLRLVDFRTVLFLNISVFLYSLNYFHVYVKYRLSFFWLSYLILLVPLSLSNTHYLDVLLSIKWILLLIVGVVISSVNLFSNIDRNYKYYSALLNIFLFFYFIFFVSGFRRQEIFLMDESNFELLILLVPAIYFIFSNKFSAFDVVKLSLIVGISGSRSGLLELGVVLFLFFNTRQFSIYLKYIIFLIGFFIIFLLLIQRGSNIEDVDRFKFLTLFLYEMNTFSFFEILFGPLRFTPLSPEVCSSLSYYDSLFSKGPDGSVCYSIIYHSFIMRVLRDHGLILSFLAFFTLYLFLVKTYSKKLAFYVLLIVLINSISVSGLANSFLWLGLLISPKKYLI